VILQSSTISVPVTSSTNSTFRLEVKLISNSSSHPDIETAPFISRAFELPTRTMVLSTVQEGSVAEDLSEIEADGRVETVDRASFNEAKGAQMLPEAGVTVVEVST
jgi:hypothetical protein